MSGAMHIESVLGHSRFAPTRNARLIMPQRLHDDLMAHLFPGDCYEHAAVILAGLHKTVSGSYRLLARELIRAEEPRDYRPSSSGFNALQTAFIHRSITRCRDERLAYLAVHNHGGRGWVAFSDVDLASHERGYPALRDIASGMPVGALVMAPGAMELDLWLPDGSRTALDRAEVLGQRRTLYYPAPDLDPSRHLAGAASHEGSYSRQELFLGEYGQALLRGVRVAIVGLGGVGSIVCELLARLGVGALILVDPDRIEISNLSRIVGSDGKDVRERKLKVKIAERVARQANPAISVEAIDDDIAYLDVARKLFECDYVFLAADSMRARLVFNALVHQYFIPGTQMGTKIKVDARSGEIESANSFVRVVTPGEACFVCNELIDYHALAQEWKTEEERRSQQYGTTLANPSVISMNAIVASHAVNDFLMYYVGLARAGEQTGYRRFDQLSGRVVSEIPRRSVSCAECSSTAESRYARGEHVDMPCALRGG